LPIGALVLLSARHVPETRDPTAHGHLDVRGAALGALALAGSTVALIDASGGGFSTSVVVTGAVGVIAFAAFLVAERRSPNPMMPLSMFSSRQFSAANMVTFVVYAAIGSFYFLLIAFLQISLGYSPIEAGAATLPVTLLMLALSARSGSLAQRIGPRIPLTVGPLIIAAGLLLLAQGHPGDGYVAGVRRGVGLVGVGAPPLAPPV